MEPPRPTPYLFLLKQPSAREREAAANWLGELGGTVVAEYGDVAVEATVSPAQLAAAAESGRFIAQVRGVVGSEHLERLQPEQRQIVELWNTRFTPEYRELERDHSKSGRSWGDSDFAEPLSYTEIDPEDFRTALAQYEERTGETLIEEGKEGEKGIEPLEGEEFVEYERLLRERLQDATLAYHFARLGQRLEPQERRVILGLPNALLEELTRRFFFREASCWRMTGRIAVGLVFVESSRHTGPVFNSAERAEICQRIFAGHSWLTSEHPTGALSWAYDIQNVRVDVPDGTGSPDESYWRNPAMEKVAFAGNTYSGDWPAVASYREDLRNAKRAAHALVIFVTPYANEWFGYAGGGRITLARNGDWGGWGRAAIDRIAAHETSHLFGSADEYTGSGTPCSVCNTLHGCDRIPNGNCGSCAHPQQDCVMNGNSHRICAYTRAQIGWSHLFVETTTADESWAGTDDDVWLDIGEREFVLDTPDWDDRERGNREGYALWAPDVEREDVHRVLLRKSPDGFAGGWKLARVRVWYRGELVCDSPANQWLEDEHRWWVGCTGDRDLVSSLRVEISTGDVMWAGTDDDVTLTLSARDWNLDTPADDFERGHTDRFDLDPSLGLRVSDLHAIRIAKSPDGFAGGWRLRGVRLIVNGSTFFDNQSINQWLEDDHRTWSANI
jgi:hypothetical protein